MKGWNRPWSGPPAVASDPADGDRPGAAAEVVTISHGSAPQRRARILFVNQYYWPDPVSTAQHLSDLAESMAAEGHDVHVLCSRGPSRPGLPRAPRLEVRQGVTIHRVPATACGRRSSASRMTDYLSFALGCGLTAARLPRFDIVVTLTTPPLVGLLGTALQKLRGSHHVCWSMDLHPDASLALGRMSRRNPIVRALAWLSDLIVRKADRVVVLGPYMGDRVLAKGVRPGRLATIPVWSRSDEITPLPQAGNPLRTKLGLESKFVAMYSGNLGLAHSFDEFLEAARLLRDRSEFVFLFVGGGPRLSEVQRAIGEHSLTNVMHLDSVPREELDSLLTLPDVHLVSMRPEMVGIVVPSKLYGAMASSRPTVFVGPEHCESADLIQQADCGLTVRRGEPEALVEALERLAASPEEAQAMGERGREAFLDQFERGVCCQAWGRLLGSLLSPAEPEPWTTRTNVDWDRPAAALRPARARVQLPDRRPRTTVSRHEASRTASAAPSR